MEMCMRKNINLNLGWKFYLGDDPNADYMGFDDRAWRDITLPHDWSVEHPFDKRHASGTGYLPGGTAWYRKRFVLTQEDMGKRALLAFGGVYKHSRVYINSSYLGYNANGYSSFTYDISDYIRSGENVISVRVEHEEVADSRWFTGSGIYRDVNLTLSDQCAFEQNGVFVYTQSVKEGTACLAVEYKTTQCDAATFTLIDGTGSTCASVTANGASGTAVLEIPGAQLWSPDSPSLYTLKAEAIKDGSVRDDVEVICGIRTFSMDPDSGFQLNGESMKLRGVCVHHDAGVLGAAVPKDVWRRRLAKMKAAGCNALRTSHNLPDSHLLDLCDEMGLLVMDEAFDEWEGAKNKWWQGHNVYPPKRFGYAEDFPQWHEFDLKTMVLRDRNHPSIIIWSIGNEIDYPNDPYVSPLFDEVLGNNDANKPAAERQYNPLKPDAKRLAIVAAKLTEIVRTYDATRPVTSALAFPELSNRTGYAQALDVIGYNYKEHLYEKDHQDYPSHVIYGSENSHDVGAWRAVLENDYICGQFLWTGIDFLGEAKGWPVRISQAGMMTMAGFEKALYYQRKALWTKTAFVKIAVGDGGGIWDERFAWQGTAGEPRLVSVYTNCERAELFINGRSLGEKVAGLENDCRAVWTVPYEEGLLEARAGDTCDLLKTAGDLTSITLSADKASLRADGQDIWQIEVELHDADGSTTPSDLPVRIQIDGDATLLGMENGLPDDLTPYFVHERRTRDGKMIAYVRAGLTKGTITLSARVGEGIAAVLTIDQA